MKKRVRWTAEEDQVLVQAIKASSDEKMKETLQNVAIQLDRSFYSVRYRWYQCLQNIEHPKYIGYLNDDTIYLQDFTENIKLPDKVSKITQKKSFIQKVKDFFIKLFTI